MENRKLFRMHHEPCQGRCYAPSEVLGLRGLGLDVEATAQLLAALIEIHEPACGREQISFALDYSKCTATYVAVFVHFGAVQTYSDADAATCLHKLIDGARNWYESEEGKALLHANPGDGKGACEHGADEDLAHFALLHSGLDEGKRARVETRVQQLLAA